MFGFPEPGATILHEYEEWQGVMKAVKEANRSFVCVELGAGWAPWLVSSAFAAKHLGISNILLIGVDADGRNLEFTKTHFSDNGLDYRQHKFFHAAIGERDARPSFWNFGGVRLMSLKTLLHDLPVVDLIHCDIQFAESKAFAAGIKEVTKRVRRVVIGNAFPENRRRIDRDISRLVMGSRIRDGLQIPDR